MKLFFVGLDEIQEFGGLPKIPFIGDLSLRYDYLNGIYNTVFTKDIVEFFNIRNGSLLRKINIYLFKELGNHFTAQNITKYFKSQKVKISVDTVLNYLNYSKSAFLFNDIERYDLKGKKILEINSKIYAFDSGIRNSVVGFDVISDIEKLLELVVLNHLLSSGYSVKVGNLGEKEIDFIVKKGNEIKYIQVCYLLSSQKVIDREFGNLLEIKDNYEKIVLSMDDFISGDYKGIKHYNLIKYFDKEFIFLLFSKGINQYIPCNEGKYYNIIPLKIFFNIKTLFRLLNNDFFVIIFENNFKYFIYDFKNFNSNMFL